MVTSLLDRRVYTFGDVDRLLGLSSGTGRRWIDGTVRERPVVRPERTRDPAVTWGEFVEARLLSEYRSADVPLVRMRPVVERLRETLGTRYPLAHSNLWAAHRELVRDAQEEAQLDDDLRLVVVERTGQLALSIPARRFVGAADFDDVRSGGAVLTLRADPDPEFGQVLLDPTMRFGRPTIDGIRTDILAELVAAGDPVETVAGIYNLPVEKVRTAVRFEERRAA